MNSWISKVTCFDVVLSMGFVLLHDDLARHVLVNRADVGVNARFTRSPECFGAMRADVARIELVAHRAQGVNHGVFVDDSYARTRRDEQLHWLKCEITDHDGVRWSPRGPERGSLNERKCREACEQEGSRH